MFKRFLVTSMSVFVVLLFLSSHLNKAGASNDDDIVFLANTSITPNLYYSNYTGSSTVYFNTGTLAEDPATGDYYYEYDDDGLQLRSNCYGYAYRFFCAIEDLPLDLATLNNFYKQNPGEFAGKTSGLDIIDPRDDSVYDTLFSRTDLDSLYKNTIESSNWNNVDKMNILVQLMQADAATLGYTLTSCPETGVPSSQTASSRRLIAIVVGGNDYHFYMQHSDGSWSHKPGTNTPRNSCFSSHVLLNNSNIAAHACEGTYADGEIRFFYITKNAVIDYKHANGQYSSCVQTSLYSTDGAGNDLNTAKNLGSASSFSQFGFIDYVGDLDYYYFTPSSTKYYTFTTSTSSSLPLQIILYNDSGTSLGTYTGNSGSLSFSYQLQSGAKYYIRLSTYNQTEHQYMRTYTVSIG